MTRNSTIDILRGIAILAVVLDHAWFLYPQFQIPYLWYQTYFSIPWFIFLSGMANTLSLEKHQFRLTVLSYVKFLIKRFFILVPYLLACLSIFLILYYPHLNWSQWTHDVLYFSFQPTYYYVNLILQLYLIFPFLFMALKISRNRKTQLGLLTLIFVITGILVYIGVPLWPLSPAARLFGGIYLSVFFLGMIFSKPIVQRNTILLVVSVVIFLISEGIIIGTNSGLPGFAQTLLNNFWAIAFLVIAFMLFNAYPKLTHAMSFLSVLGKHSYIIYLFHFFLLQYLTRYLNISSILTFVGLIIASILLPLIISMAYSGMIKFLHFPIKSVVSKTVAL